MHDQFILMQFIVILLRSFNPQDGSDLLGQRTKESHNQALPARLDYC